jgi:hypothetical protein
VIPVSDVYPKERQVNKTKRQQKERKTKRKEKQKERKEKGNHKKYYPVFVISLISWCTASHTHFGGDTRS